MVMNILYFVVGVLAPHAAEQYAYRMFAAGSKTDATVAQGYGWRVLWDAAYFFVLLACGYRFIFSGPPFFWWEWLGYMLYLSGVVLRIWALRALGQFYDAGIAIKADHQLIVTGPYRILRHPLHLGTVLKISGLSLFSPAWLAIPAVLASLLLDLNLNRTEDRTHAGQFNSSFKAYYANTWDIVDLVIWKNKAG